MKAIAGKKLETKPEIKSATNNKKENKDRKVSTPKGKSKINMKDKSVKDSVNLSRTLTTKKNIKSVDAKAPKKSNKEELEKAKKEKEEKLKEEKAKKEKERKEKEEKSKEEKAKKEKERKEKEEKLKEEKAKKKKKEKKKRLN